MKGGGKEEERKKVGRDRREETARSQKPRVAEHSKRSGQPGPKLHRHKGLGGKYHCIHLRPSLNF